MAAVRDLGYRPDMLAQGLRTRKTLSVGFTVSDIANPVLAEAITGAERRLRAGRLLDAADELRGRRRARRREHPLLEQRRVDGLILSPRRGAPPARRSSCCAQADVPIVLLDRDSPAA